MLLGEPDLVANLAGQPPTEQRSKHPSDGTGEAELQGARDLRAAVDGRTFEAGFEAGDGMREAIERQRRQRDIDAPAGCQPGLLDDLGLGQPGEGGSTGELQKVAVAPLPEDRTDLLVYQRVALDAITNSRNSPDVQAIVSVS